MKKIGIAMLLIASIGCWSPAVRAEAPTTKKGGCWSREIAVRPLAQQPLTTISGRVVAIEHNDKNQPIAAKEVVTWARVKTPNGAEKSVYLGSERYLNQQQLNLKVSDVIEIQGVQTLKPKRLPTIVASTVKKGDRVWNTNNLASKPTGTKWCRFTG